MRRSDTGSFQRRLEEAAAWVNEGLEEASLHRGSLSRLPSLAAYSLRSGGKRVRPFLVRAACEAVGGLQTNCLCAACAVEMIHTYSLVHDDLPCMDDDDYRRGVPALHTMFGGRQALLAGDLLLVEAFAELLKTPLGPDRVAEMVRRLARAAGPLYLAGGQYMDMYPEDDPGEKWVRRMILGKTAAMIRVSLELGAIAGIADDGVLEAVSLQGDRLGFLFQLTDDILDRRGSAEEMGKEVSKDLERGKRNQLSLMSLEEAEAEAEELARGIASDFEDVPGDWSDVSALALYLPGRRR